jgi:hypothetical protein
MHQCINNRKYIKSEDFAARVVTRIFFSSPFRRDPQKPAPDPPRAEMVEISTKYPQNTLNNRYLNMLAPYVYIRHN